MPDPPEDPGGDPGTISGPPMCEYLFDELLGDWLLQNGHQIPPGWHCTSFPDLPPAVHGDTWSLPAEPTP
jgi:hypothetical protein